MDNIKIIIRTADKTRKAEIDVSPLQRVSEVIKAAQDNWSLPSDIEYTTINTSSGTVLNAGDTLEKAGVNNGDVLEIQPHLVAGLRWMLEQKELKKI